MTDKLKVGYSAMLMVEDGSCGSPGKVVDIGSGGAIMQLWNAVDGYREVFIPVWKIDNRIIPATRQLFDQDP